VGGRSDFEVSHPSSKERSMDGARSTAVRILFMTVIRGETDRMASKKKPGKVVAPKKELKKTAKKSKPAASKKAKGKPSKAPKSKGKKLAKAPQLPVVEVAQLISSEVVYQGPLFRVLHDKIIEPSGKHNERDVIRHNGSVVILAIDSSKSKKNPWIVIERQYRHAANQYLWELPAGKLDAGETPLAGAQRELAEETGYSAKKWKPLVEYYASPGFLGESMKVFVAEGLVAGDATPEEDEEIEFRLVKMSEVLKMIEKGAIKDGKTLTSVLLYARLTAGKRKK
jgi:ADP-ribose pyrophosphatase